MTVSQQEREQTRRPDTHLVRWAWLAIGLAPVGLAVSVAVLFLLASAMNVELFPQNDSQGATFVQGLILAVVTALVAVASPTVAVVLAVKAARNAEPSATVARRVAVTVLAVVCLLLLLAVGSVVGIVAIAMIGLVLAATLRRQRPAS